MPPSLESPQSVCSFGVAQGDVTPPVGIYHRMWGAAAHERSTGVHRPLMAAAAVIAPPGRPSEGVVLVTLDHCLFWDLECRRLLEAVAAKSGVDQERLLVAFSHTHAAGLMDGRRADRPGGELIAPYLADLADRVAALIVEAVARAGPATLCYANGRCDLAAHRDLYDEASGRFVCGYNPEGPADDTVVVVRATDADGRTLATLINYACHPTTLAWENTLISPDFPGAMREVVEQATGVPCLFLQGASGDLGPREGFVGDPAVADRNGRQLGYAALSALEGMPPPRTRFEFAGAVESGAVLGPWRHAPLDADRLRDLEAWDLERWTVELPYRADLPTADATRADRARWADEERDALGCGDRARAAECRAFVERMDRQLIRIGELPPGPAFPFEVLTWKTGGAVWLAVKGEHYQHLQVELRRRVPGVPILVMTLVNGWQPGYLPTASSYDRGIYQAEIAVVGAGSLETLTDDIAVRISAWSPA
ncbi:neutral/alkaline non-lysosomal ceramidase N-terminal domain-containing protein [Planctomyces sp. SH-PL62]|uniref:neutral/alkaline non-lysosomal ceramidase N-terminal domain-containing protein n=1 Tax=Planctomyces sp. SH-PL62 TaxID=1636152 RepID=UPI00078D6AD6|nr:neutral/alkaline non-lysosomal ceramidase N-terminal domain-containing protein [Planctomyces sp. SH-PL62]AMV39055.1 Neutral ceramidase precursor [Planctomyces sp. SH-PL62]